MPHRLSSPLLGLAVLLLASSLIAPSVPTLSANGALAQATPATDSGAAQPANQCPAPEGFSDTSVTVGLEPTFTPGAIVSFGLPLPVGAVRDAATLAVSVNGQPVQATASVLLNDLDPDGVRVGVRSVLIQFPSSVLPEGCATVDVATYSIEEQNGLATLVTKDRQQRVLFAAREPALTATFPSGYLAATGILGHQV